MQKYPYNLRFNRPEAYNNADVDSDTNIPLDVGIHDIEDHGNAKTNAGFYEKGILQAMEGDHDSPGQALREIKVIANGHCHSTSICFLLTLRNR